MLPVFTSIRITNKKYLIIYILVVKYIRITNKKYFIIYILVVKVLHC